MTIADTVRLLDSQLQKGRSELRRLESYFEGTQALRYLAPVVAEKFGPAVLSLVLNWPRLVVEAYDERSDIEGFRFKGAASGDQHLWDLWQASNGDENAPMAHMESLITGRAFVIVGTDEDGEPIFTVEHPYQCVVRRDPRTRRVVEGLKRWEESDADGKVTQWATLYGNGYTSTLARDGRDWVELDRDEHGLPPLMVPLLNRGRILKQDGRSEFVDIMPVADAANKIATDMMTAAEHHAIPRRWMLGMTEDDFTDENGQPLPVFEAATGAIWSTESEPGKAEFGQFSASDLGNFHNTVRLLAQLAGQLAGLPEDYMAFASDNPASADAIRAAEARFVKRCERKHVGWGGGWEDVMRLMLRVEDPARDASREAMKMETLWRDPSTPTRAQMADAVVKLVQAKILPVDFGREALGYNPEQRRQMEELDRKAAAADPIEILADQFRTPTPTPAAQEVPAGGAG